MGGVGFRAVLAASLVSIAACGGSDPGDPDAAPPQCVLDSDCEDGNFCTHQWCDQGTCRYVDDNEGDACDDGDPCTENDVCQSGQCQSQPIDCSAMTDFCNDGVCDPQAGGCVARPKDDGTSCDDGMFCTENDVCTSGVCGGSARDCSSFDGECSQGVCNENSAACEAAPINEGLSCNDGMFCTTGETCQSGSCTGGAQRDCSNETDQCNTGVCDEGQGACVKAPVTDGTGCSDGLFCTTGDQCIGGSCTPSGTVDCSSLNSQCATGVCDETNQECTTTPANEGSSCNDNLYCTVGETCQSGTCTAGTQRDCADTDACTNDSCDEGADSCVNTQVPPIAGAEGPPGHATCSDGIDNDCDGDADLDDASCVGCTQDSDCNDNNPCTADVCNASAVCDNTPMADNTPCNDGLFCTNPDVCTAGVCGGPARDCSGQNDQCNVGACSETNDTCIKSPSNEGGSCNDGAFCTNPDTCTNGTCGGPVRDCSAFADSCNDGLCDESAGTCYASPKSNGVSCDLGFCTTGETCLSGTCQGGTANDCDDADACTADSCDEVGNACRNDPVTIDPNSVVATSADATAPLDVCLTAGTDARVLVWTDLVDQNGAPLSGAAVTIGGMPATESSARPGTYYREVLASSSTGSIMLTVAAAACGDSRTLSTTVAIENTDANSTSGGTGGCSPMGGNLRVKVVDDSGVPLAGASVLVGQAEGTPFMTSPEAVFGGGGAAGSNVATTDASGFASFYDYGNNLDGGVMVTAGATNRAYFTIAGSSAADLVLSLPLLHPPVVTTTIYDNGTGSLGGIGCGDLDAALILPKLELDFLSQFNADALFGEDRCWNSNNNNVGTVAVPSNLWIPGQSIGPFCLGGSLAQAPWSLTLKNTAGTGVDENLAMLAGTADVFDVQDILSNGGGIADILPILNYRAIGFHLDETVPTSPTSGRSINVNDDMPGTVTVTFTGKPNRTDVVGVVAGDYSGSNGSGPLFLTSTGVRAWDATGSTVSMRVSDLNASGSPTTARNVAGVAALYLDPDDHTGQVAANRLSGISSVLIRQDASGNEPFGGTGTTNLTVSSFLDVAGPTFTPPRTFTWENATGSNGNAPLYSIHELMVRTRKYLPVLSCETENEVREEFSVQWIVARPFDAGCNGDECFTLPVLPSSFPRSSSGTQMKAGFEQLVGSGVACTSDADCVVTGETCQDPDGAGSAAMMCMAGSGTAAAPWHLQDYRWHLHLYDLELAPSFDFNDFAFADRITYMTHESSNKASFD